MNLNFALRVFIVCILASGAGWVHAAEPAAQQAIQVRIGSGNVPPRAGEALPVQVQARDPASGFGLSGTMPALWFLPLPPGPDNEGCERRFNRLAGAAHLPSGAIDINGFDVLQATADGRLARVDPVFNLNTANIRSILDLGATPDAWALTADGRHLLVADGGRRLLQVVDVDHGRVIGSQRLPAAATALLETDGTVWIGLADGRLLRLDGAALLSGDATIQTIALGRGPVRLASSGDTLLAVAESGDALLQRGGRALQQWQLPSRVAGLAFSPRADSFYALAHDGRSVLALPLDAPDAAIGIALDQPMRNLVANPGGQWLALTANDGRTVTIIDSARQRPRWSIQVNDPVIAAEFSDAFLYLAHTRQGGASRVVFDPDGGPPAVVTIAAGSQRDEPQRAGTLPMLARIPAAGMLVANSRDRVAYMVSDDNAQAAMSSLPLRAGTPAGIALRYRGLQAGQARGDYRAQVTFPHGGDWLAIVRTSQPDLLHCVRLAVTPAAGEATPTLAESPAPTAARALQAALLDGGRSLRFTISGSADIALVGASLVGDGWQRMPANIQRDGDGYRMPLEMPPPTPFTLVVRYRDAGHTYALVWQPDTAGATP